MRAHFGLPSVEKEEVEGRPPIGVKFEIPYFTVSGIQVREGGRVVPLLDLGGSPFLSFLGLDRLRSLAWLISSFTVILFFFFLEQPDIPVSLERNTEDFRQHFLGAPSTLLIWTGG